MIRYDLARMLEEIKQDEPARAAAGTGQKILSQEQIRSMARSRRPKPGDKARAK